jgi:translation initiation factor IF-1
MDKLIYKSNAIVLEFLDDRYIKVKLEDGRTFLATIPGKQIVHKLKVSVGDNIIVLVHSQVSDYVRVHNDTWGSR